MYYWLFAEWLTWLCPLPRWTSLEENYPITNRCNNNINSIFTTLQVTVAVISVLLELVTAFPLIGVLRILLLTYLGTRSLKATPLRVPDNTINKFVTWTNLDFKALSHIITTGSPCTVPTIYSCISPTESTSGLLGDKNPQAGHPCQT